MLTDIHKADNFNKLFLSGCKFGLIFFFYDWKQPGLYGIPKREEGIQSITPFL
jgi:hypothetical protein